MEPRTVRRTSIRPGQLECGEGAERERACQLGLLILAADMAVTKTWPRAPFPSDLKTHPLLIIDYAKLEAGDEKEVDRLWQGLSARPLRI